MLASGGSSVLGASNAHAETNNRQSARVEVAMVSCRACLDQLPGRHNQPPTMHTSGERERPQGLSDTSTWCGFPSPRSIVSSHVPTDSDDVPQLKRYWPEPE